MNTLSQNFKSLFPLMGVSLRLIVSICLLCSSHYLLGQQTKDIHPDSTLRFDFFATNDSTTSYFVVETNTSRATMDGYNIVRKITPTIWIVQKEDPTKIYSKEVLVRLAPANIYWKYAPLLLACKQLESNKQDRFTVVGTTLTSLETVLDKYRTTIRDIQMISAANAAIVTCSFYTLNQFLLKEDAIIFADITQKASPEIELIGYDRSLHGIQEIDVNIPNANGANIVIGIKESDMDAQDIDLVKRVKSSTLAHPEKDVHASVVATLAGGAGNSSINGKGLAWKSNFYPSSYDLLFPDNASILQQNNVSIQNHSYGTIVQSFYGAEAVAYDAQQYNIPYLLHVFSSGNRGTTAPNSGTYNGIVGYANLTGNFKMSKNSITVGATDTSGSITPFSSAGPMYDGRLAPHVTALGPNGTSDAAAIVSGGIAVLQQVYKDSNLQQLPNAALVKALLFNGADDINQKGIDYKSGYGTVNILKAVKALQQKKYIEGNISNGQSINIPFEIPSNAANIKFTLVWNDPAAAINNSVALVNNIDFELTEISTGNVFRPWVLSTAPFADSLALPARRGVDNLNNAEQISINNSNGNNYVLTVKGSRITGSGSQRFSVAYQWDTLGSFRFTNPINASDINLDESNFIKIKWEAILENIAQTGTLSVSRNSGNTWSSISNNVSIRNGVYNWSIPDSMGTALFKMEYDNKAFFSNEVIIAPTSKLAVDFFCEDSLQLSWNEHVYADHYEVFQLLDSAYLKKVGSTNNRFIRLPNNSNSNTVFAVQAILNNGLYATRSPAINPAEQGVACFYSTLLANAFANSMQLDLALSIPSLTDSIVFEKIFPLSNQQKKLAVEIVQGNSTTYSALDDAPLPGLNSYRARIYSKTGTVIVTNTVSLLSNTGEKIWIYPNPARRGTPIQFKLRDISVGNQLQLFNSNGQLVSTIAIGAAGSIPTTGLSVGTYLFKILQSNKSIVTTGKIIITN